MIGRTLSHYTVVEKIGHGGMGEVYRAQDTLLGREVAVKVLPPSVADDEQALARFQHEARAVAALSHPNILAIYEFGTDGDVAFTVTELLRGAVLRDRLAEGPLPAETALDYARQILAGLSATHERGLVHRDLKPENLFVTGEGRVKILDYGLAKVIAQDVPHELGSALTTLETMPGTILGSLAYMSPEQVRGAPAQPSSDLFSFGVILHEMLSGSNPFHRASAAETMSAILRDDPAPIGGPHSGVEAVIRWCLRKTPEERPQSAREVASRLGSHRTESRASAPGRGESPIDSLAVLPFRNESDDPEVDYLSEGITDTIIDNLCQLPRLRVMARSSVFRYHDVEVDPQEAGGALGVGSVLTGRLRLRRDQIEVRAELVDVHDGRQLWGKRFKRPLADLLAIEDEIAREISENLQLELNRDEKALLAKRHTRDAQAHQAYLQGRSVWNRWKTPEGMRAAIGFFEEALAMDPLYALAYAGLADAYSMLGNVKAVPPEEAYPAAKTAALQGLAIDGDVAELHTSLGFVHRFWDWDWKAAEGSFQRAIELNPGYATVHRFYSQLLAGLCHHDRAIVVANQALALDPLSLIIQSAVGDIYFYARRYDEAIAIYRKIVEADPQFLPGHTDLARACELAGRYDEAIAEFEIAAALAPKGPPDPSSGLAHVYGQMGEREKALEILEQLKAMRARRYVSPYGIASIHAVLGENGAALDWLETAYAEHDQTLVWVKAHPRMDGLRNEPRYLDLLRKMNLA